MATVISALVRLKPENCHESEASQDIGWEINFSNILYLRHIKIWSVLHTTIVNIIEIACMTILILTYQIQSSLYFYHRSKSE